MAQAGAFSSTTTVTGLPSTPSRKPTRHPQARRACVNPFSMDRSYYSPTAWAGRSDQPLDLALDLGLGGDSGVFLRDLAVAPDDHRHRNGVQRTKGLLHVLASVADEQAVVDLVLRGIRPHLFDGVVQREAQHGQIIAVLLLELHERRDL